MTDEQLRKILKRRVGDQKQVHLAKEIGVKPQNLSIAIKGAPIGGKILAWLGYERVDGIYRRKS